MKKSGMVSINTEIQYEPGKENLESQVYFAVFFSFITPDKQMSLHTNSQVFHKLTQKIVIPEG